MAITAFPSSTLEEVGLSLRHKVRTVAAVKEDHPAEFVVLKENPATSLYRIHFIVAIPGPLHRWHAFPGCQLAVYVCVVASRQPSAGRDKLPQTVADGCHLTRRIGLRGRRVAFDTTRAR